MQTDMISPLIWPRADRDEHTLPFPVRPARSCAWFGIPLDEVPALIGELLAHPQASPALKLILSIEDPSAQEWRIDVTVMGSDHGEIPKSACFWEDLPRWLREQVALDGVPVVTATCEREGWMWNTYEEFYDD
jgi:hypothetical protein